MGAERIVILGFLTCLQYNLIFALFVLFFLSSFIHSVVILFSAYSFPFLYSWIEGKKRVIIYSEPKKKDFTGKNKASHTMFPTQTCIISIALISVSCIWWMQTPVKAYRYRPNPSSVVYSTFSLVDYAIVTYQVCLFHSFVVLQYNGQAIKVSSSSPKGGFHHSAMIHFHS